MDPDLPPRRRALLLPVVITTVLLTGAGVAAGLGLSAQDRDRGQAAGPTPAVAATTPEVFVPSGPPCRPETQAMGERAGATGSLTEVLKVRTKSSTVWICEDRDGRFYYHANRGGDDSEWEEGKTALFLDGVRGEGDAWVVTAADGTRFSVNADRLLIIHKDGEEEEQQAR